LAIALINYGNTKLVSVNTDSKKHGMSYEQFEVYLRRRSTLLMTTPNAQLGQAILVDEEDAFEWKVAHEMLLSWLGLQSEIEQ